jgi:hypothetical protein
LVNPAAAYSSLHPPHLIELPEAAASHMTELLLLLLLLFPFTQGI